MSHCSTIDPAQLAELTPARPAWSARTPLLEHQVEAVAKLLPSRAGALYMEMGTGKGRTTIEIARLRQAKIDHVIWFCPVAVKPTILTEIRKHTNCDEHDIYVFDDATDASSLPMGARWYIVGIESMGSSQRVVSAVAALVSDRTMMVVDESTYIKGHFAKRTRRITLLGERAKYRMVLSGTPITQGIVDLYAQMRFLSPKILGYNSFYSFAANHLVYSDKFKGLITRVLNTDWITERIRPYVYQVTKADCLSLPPKLYEEYHFELSSQQWAAYEAAKLDFCNDLDRFARDGEMQNGIAIFRLFSRLQSIVCGYDCGVPGSPSIRHNRLHTLDGIVEQVQDSHTVIWTKYQRSVDEIVAHFGAKGHRAYAFDGRVPEKKRQPIIDQWVAKGGLLVATQSLGGHGLNELVAASTAIFYANGFKYSERVQTEDRHHRIGQTRSVTYIDIWSDAKIETRIADALATKGDALTALRREISAVQRTNKQRVRDLVMAL